jgi:hypothetical protein
MPTIDISCAEPHLQQARQCLNKPVTYTPREKDYTVTTALKERAEKAASVRRMQAIQLSALLKRDRLPAADIRTARQLITDLIPKYGQAKYYAALQSKVNYQNQRDSKVSGYSMWDGTFGQWRNVGNEMCNLSSLGMAMLYQGITMDDLEAKLKALGFTGTIAAQYDDRLEQIRHQMALNATKGKPAKTTLRRDTWTTLKTVGESFGLTVDKQNVGKRNQDWYIKNVQSQLEQGHSVIMSYNGHIVRVQAVTESGLVVDDPFGRVQILKGSAINIPWNTNANSTDGKRITGEDRVLPWTQVEAHAMYWMEVIKWPK